MRARSRLLRRGVGISTAKPKENVYSAYISKLRSFPWRYIYLRDEFQSYGSVDRDVPTNAEASEGGKDEERGV